MLSKLEVMIESRILANDPWQAYLGGYEVCVARRPLARRTASFWNREQVVDLANMITGRESGWEACTGKTGTEMRILMDQRPTAVTSR